MKSQPGLVHQITSCSPRASSGAAACRTIFLKVVVLLFLLGGVNARAQDDYGRELPIEAKFEAGPSMDVVTISDLAYVIGQGNLRIFDIRVPTSPRLVGEVGGLGNTRQIVVAKGIAYVSAREDGLFIVDVKVPQSPRLLCHYDSVEWATGVAVSGDVLFIAHRQFGVELVDISNPERPQHLSTVRTGEAQSVVVRDGWLYTGVWGSSEIVVADVRDARSPVITAKVRLDGFGDGVDLKGKYLYAATGHHSPGARRDPADPRFGRGHGLEIFDVSDPAQPKFVSRLKFPKFHVVGNDWWAVTVAGDHAFVADTHNGIFVVDVSVPEAPRCVAHRQLPVPLGAKLPDAVGGLAPIRDHILVAGGGTDLFVVGAKGLASLPEVEPSSLPVIGPAVDLAEKGLRVYRPGGQIYAAAMFDGQAIVACGVDGIRLVETTPVFREIAVQPTADVVTDVCVLGRTVFAAEGLAGLSIWSIDENNQFHLKGRYRAEGLRVRHVAVPPPGRYAVLQVGGQDVHIVDLSVPGRPTLALRDTQHGLLYGQQVLDGLVANRYSAVFWHASGLHWYDLYGSDKPRYVAQRQPERFGVLDGITVFNDRILATRNGGLVLIAPNDLIDELPHVMVPNQRLNGKPSIDGNRLFVSNRATGVITLVDITAPSKPTLLRTIVTPGNPGRVIPVKGGFMVPDGYNGLLFFEEGQ